MKPDFTKPKLDKGGKARVYAPDRYDSTNPYAQLPHLGRKLYAWQRRYIDSRNKINLMTAANQVGKSTSLIIKNIHWATSPELWPELFPHRQPKQFWYLYPDWGTVESEFKEKWEAEFLPRGKKKVGGQYSWKPICNKKGEIRGISFPRNGLNIWFHVYSQKLAALMAATVSMVTFDEEIPIAILPELQARLQFTDGYLNGGFTATLCQDYWYRAMECRDNREVMKTAFKQQISLFDCVEYEDGSPSEIWTPTRIQTIIDNCTSENEVLRRVYGRFVAEETVKYSSFSPERHFIKPFLIPENWVKYAAVDLGSGGAKNHPASIAFVAADPEHTKCVVYKGWRGDGIETTASDVMTRFKELRGGDRLTGQTYDHSSKDFGIIAARLSEPFVAADKSRELGEETINTLFRNNALLIFDIPELQALGTEFATLRHKTKKQTAKDDFIDAVRYCIMQIPFAWDNVILKEIDASVAKQLKDKAKLDPVAEQIKMRRGEMEDDSKDPSWGELDDECRFWNEQYGN